MGAWIEILLLYRISSSVSSLPSWERGLKFQEKDVKYGLKVVAPLVGAWIEICKFANKPLTLLVAPLVGAWIEIEMCLLTYV